MLLAFVSARAVCAASATSNLTVSATVSAACQISSVGNISFGAYDPLSATPTDGTGNLVFRCVKGTSYKTYIAGTRVMTAGSNTLSFQLYTDASRTAVFPNTNLGGSTTSQGISPITQSIYGRISAGQDVTAASYTSTLVATVEY